MHSISELQDILQINDPNAIILDEIDPIKGQTSVKICCSNKHKVRIRIQKILEKKWVCRNCNQRKHTIELFHEIAKKHEGKCLSEKYIGLNKHLLFECKIGHTWKATSNNIKNKHSWCPECKDLVNQERCRVILEILFQKKFKICCPKFLYDKTTKKTLELDMYNEELKLACEYQGVQHYEIMPWDKGNDSRLKRQIEKDLFKIKKCKENNIILLVISYKKVKFKKDNLVKSYIIQELKTNNIPIPEQNIKILEEINIQNLIKGGNKKYHKYKKDVLDILSRYPNSYLINPDQQIVHNRLTKFIVNCGNGHKFETTRERLMDKRRRWCPKCAIERKRKK